MKRTLLKISTVFPLLGMLLPMACGFFQPGYSSVSQQLSELELLGGPVAAATRMGAIVAGLSIVGFAVAVFLGRSSRMPFTAGAAFVFGVSMVANGIFTMGSRMHGFYAIGLSVILVPAFFAAEFRQVAETGKAETVSLAASVLVLLYMWLLMTRLDPAGWQGLTQRLAVIPMFGWFTYASLKLLRRIPR